MKEKCDMPNFCCSKEQFGKLKNVLSASSDCFFAAAYWVHHGCMDMLVGEKLIEDGYANMYLSTSFNVHAAFVQDFKILSSPCQ